MARRHNPRRVQTHRTYNRREIAELFDVAYLTVHKWRNEGLEPDYHGKPELFSGATVKAFIEARNKPHVPLLPGEFFCVCCKKSVRAEGEKAIFVPYTDSCGDLQGNCATCGRRLFRRTRTAEIAEKAGTLTVDMKTGKHP
ncbi:MAG: hypothetical protein AB7U35_08895 [Sphingobium sp.]